MNVIIQGYLASPVVLPMLSLINSVPHFFHDTFFAGMGHNKTVTSFWLPYWLAGQAGEKDHFLLAEEKFLGRGSQTS